MLALCAVLFPPLTKLLTMVDEDNAGTLNTVEDVDTMDDKGGNERSITSSKTSPFVSSPSTFLPLSILN